MAIPPRPSLIAMDGVSLPTMMKTISKITTTAILTASVAGCGLGGNVKAPEKNDDAITVVEPDALKQKTEKENGTSEVSAEKANFSVSSSSRQRAIAIEGEIAETVDQDAVVNEDAPEGSEARTGTITDTAPVTGSNTIASGSDQAVTPTTAVALTTELTPYQKELNRLTEEINKTAEKLTLAKAAYKKAQDEYNEANATLRSMTSLTFNDNEALEIARALVGAKKAALEVAVGVLEQAEEDYAG